MIWALIIVTLAAVFGGNSPFVIPHLDKYVKTHIVDDSEKEIVLDLLKDAKAKRKETSKTNADYLKELHNLSISRESTKEEFDDLAKKIFTYNMESQAQNLKATSDAQKHITAQEWKAIQVEIAEDLIKSDKSRKKDLQKLESAFDKRETKINKTIIDEAKRKEALQSIKELREINIANYKKIQAELLNKNSVAFKYKATDVELKNLQNELVEWTKEVFEANTKIHFDIVNATTPEEWKKIQ